MSLGVAEAVATANRSLGLWPLVPTSSLIAGAPATTTGPLNFPAIVKVSPIRRMPAALGVEVPVMKGRDSTGTDFAAGVPAELSSIAAVTS